MKKENIYTSKAAVTRQNLSLGQNLGFHQIYARKNDLIVNRIQLWAKIRQDILFLLADRRLELSIVT